MSFDEIKIPALSEDQDVVVTVADKTFSIKGLIDLLINFINMIIKFEF